MIGWGKKKMIILNFLFKTLMGCLIIIAMLLAVVIALYMLKIMLTELFDGKGVDEFVLWLKDTGTKLTSQKKK